MWQNSLVFHSLDKLTSFFLHFFPPLHLHLFRWRHTNPPFVYLIVILNTPTLFHWSTHSIPNNNHSSVGVSFPVQRSRRRTSSTLEMACSFLCSFMQSGRCVSHTFSPLSRQVVYLVITEGLLHKAMEEDPALVTSMRCHLSPVLLPGIWLRTQRTRCIRWQRRRVAPWASFQGNTLSHLPAVWLFREESFDSRTMKTKAIFVVTQIFYTMLTLLPTTLFFSSYRLR